MSAPVHVRDKRDPGFAIVDNEIIEVHGPVIGPFGIAVYVALAVHAGQRGTCDRSITDLAHEVKASPRKVRDTIGMLAVAGLIEIEHRPTGAGRNHLPNVYTLLPVVKLAKYTGHPTAPHAVATAHSAVPLRHHMPKATASHADLKEQEQPRTSQDQQPPTPAPIAQPVPAATAATGDASLPDASPYANGHGPAPDPLPVEHTRKWDPFFAHVGAVLKLNAYQKRKPADPAAWARDLSLLFGPLSGNDPAAAVLLFDQFTAWAKRARYGSGKRWDFIKASTVNDHAAAWARDQQQAGSVTANGHAHDPTYHPSLAGMLADEARYGLSPEAKARAAEDNLPNLPGLPF